MEERFDVPLDELEARARVDRPRQVETHPVPGCVDPVLAGPGVHPYGDGATGLDGDGD